MFLLLKRYTVQGLISTFSFLFKVIYIKGVYTLFHDNKWFVEFFLILKHFELEAMGDWVCGMVPDKRVSLPPVESSCGEKGKAGELLFIKWNLLSLSFLAVWANHTLPRWFWMHAASFISLIYSISRHIWIKNQVPEFRRLINTYFITISN